ncbi:MAG: hypothetical protein JW750_03405 [Anaerolineaceae bacterium]|nr:hypothetical protein [Anaerolineaceae bacterium]
MTATIKVCVGSTEHPDSNLLERLSALVDDNVKLVSPSHPASGADYHMLINGSPTREELEASPSLRAVVMPWAGISPKLSALMKEFPQITLHNLHHNASMTAEMAITLLMAASRQTTLVDQRMHQCDWRPRLNEDYTFPLHGKTVLIIGFGSIGQRIGLFCQALGMDILAIRRNPEKPLLPGLKADVYPPDALTNLLPRARVLIIAAPHTDETANLIDEAEFNLLPDDSLLVNIGRGVIVNQWALYHALQNGKLRAAGSDVWYNYPRENGDYEHQQPADAPLHELENLIMSPHRGGGLGSDETESMRAAALAELINAMARGETIPNRVDLDLGY